ncbi:MAG TPA: NAD(P)H-hydrate dehydratase [Acetobacteraceae bacterium]|nr:NAD(P)H-hydrate dehydratase [Acetobacteraceae bacterium]
MLEALLTPKEMAQADAKCGVPVPVLMQAAGRAVARAVQARFRPCRTLVLCGPGNNGGDGRVAARLLAQSGWPVRVAAPGDSTFTAIEAARSGLVIDALFGAGLSRDLSPQVADVLRAAPRLVAVDVPSGLDGGTGQVRGFAPQAVLTVTFFRRKPGHLLLPGRALCGELLLADIGMPAAVLDTVRPTTFRNTPALWALPAPGADSHKYTRGHLTILGGAAMTGAARLAAMAAHRGGAGLVTVAAQGSAAIYRAGDPGILVSEAPLADLLADSRRVAWLCGPGLGELAGECLATLLAAGRAVVADADALTACAGHPERLAGAAVLTPHDGEFSRVFGPIGPDRLAAARAAAARTGAVLVLKGPATVIAAPDGRAAINDNAPPWLATAGSGDVLGGIIAALLAQGMARWEAACAGVWLHGRAGQAAGAGLIAEDLPACLPSAIAAAKESPRSLFDRV